MRLVRMRDDRGEPRTKEHTRDERHPPYSTTGCRTALSEQYDTALLDLDGVVYAGGDAIAHAVDSLAAARETGMKLAT